jgi:hypothetical protein
MPELSEWLKIMIGEVARKDEEESRARAETHAREAESAVQRTSRPTPTPSTGA